MSDKISFSIVPCNCGLCHLTFYKGDKIVFSVSMDGNDLMVLSTEALLGKAKLLTMDSKGMLEELSPPHGSQVH